jgi:hypothetical protein
MIGGEMTNSRRVAILVCIVLLGILSGRLFLQAGYGFIAVATVVCLCVSIVLGWRLTWLGVVGSFVYNASSSGCILITIWTHSGLDSWAQDVAIFLIASLLLTLPAAGVAKVVVDARAGKA